MAIALPANGARSTIFEIVDRTQRRNPRAAVIGKAGSIL